MAGILAVGLGPIGPFEGIILFFLFVPVVVSWLFYKWGAAIAAGTGRSRALGWWAVFFGLLGILVIWLLPGEQKDDIPQTGGPGESMAGQLERLAALRQSGALTEEEFEASKRELLS